MTTPALIPIPAPLFAAAAAPLRAILDAAARTPLDTRTPCAEWDLAGLARHLRHWSPLLIAAGTHSTPPPSAPGGDDLTDWAVAHAAATDELVAAWGRPEAWEGEVAVGSPRPAPAVLIGGMVFAELVLHGWDLARTAGVEGAWDDEVLAAALRVTTVTAEQGRAYGTFGPAVVIDPDAPLLDRLLAVSGRDPHWPARAQDGSA